MTLSKTQRDNHPQKSYSTLNSARDKDLGEEPSAFSELFHGFLAIGTLGTDQVIAGPSAPIYSIPVDNLADEETGVTESELRLINEELVKVLGADSNKSSGTGRNNYANAGRSSQGSTITLSGKPMEGNESVNGPITCPLHGYLLGTAMGMPETTVPKKINKASLKELFQKTKIAEENSKIKYERAEKRAVKEADRSAVKLLKTLLKKKMIHASSRSSTTSSGGTTDSATAYKKRPKVCLLMQKLIGDTEVKHEEDCLLLY